MNENIENILEQPIQVRIGILVGTAVVLLAGYYFILFAPLGEDLEKTTKEVESLELEISEKRGIAANLPRFEMEVDRLDVELAKALKELPDKKEIELLLAKISDKARDAGLDIRLFQPMPQQNRDFYAEVPVQIQVAGTFHQVATFFDEVGHLERIVNLNEFDMKVPAGGSQQSDPAVIGGGAQKKGKVTNKQAAPAIQLTTSVVATSFRFLEESERPDANKDKKDGKRRGKKKAKAKGGAEE